MQVNPYQGSAENQRIFTAEKSLGKDEFLKILSAQLQFQDPLSGGDNTQYIAQMAQFSSLEQIENLNKSFEKFLSFQNLQYGSQLIGKEVLLMDGEEYIQGMVEKVRIIEGNPMVVINGSEYSMDSIQEIK